MRGPIPHCCRDGRGKTGRMVRTGAVGADTPAHAQITSTANPAGKRGRIHILPVPLAGPGRGTSPGPRKPAPGSAAAGRLRRAGRRLGKQRAAGARKLIILPRLLDQVLASGEWLWKRAEPSSGRSRGRLAANTPICLLRRECWDYWPLGPGRGERLPFGAQAVFDALREGGADFFQGSLAHYRNVAQSNRNGPGGTCGGRPGDLG